MIQPADRAEIERALAMLADPGNVVELRIPKAGRDRTRSGYFDDMGKLADEAVKLSGRYPGLYITLNPVNPALLARCANKTVPYAEVTTSDADVLRRRWLPIDIDPVRLSGVSSSEAEHAAARELAREVREWLTGLGWPLPIYADSGNGAHLLYRVDLPNTDEARELIKRCLAALAERFNTEQAKVDPSVHNAARIWKLYGTLSAKGENLPERPHRLAHIAEVPETLAAVSMALLEALGGIPEPQPDPRQQPGHGRRFDLDGFMARHGLAVSRTKPWHGGTLHELAECPFNPEHKRTARLTRNPAGALGFQCFHESCQGKDWQALRAKLEPERVKERRPQEPTSSSDDVVDRLANLSVLDYEKVRDVEAKKLGVRVGVLDGLVAQRRREQEVQAKGNGFADDLEPWPDPVDGAELLAALRDTVRTYVVLPEYGAETVALWVVFAHSHDAFDISPILAGQSPRERCGKTTKMKVLKALVPHPLTSANLTPAVLYRVIEAAGPTLLIDEADAFLGDKEELRGVLDSGHDRDSAYVWRCVGDNQEPQRFSTWAPKAIAQIGEFARTLQDRSIVIRLRRKLKTEKVTRWRKARAKELQPLARQAARWAADNLDALRAADPHVPDALNDRAADNWRPLIAIADRAGGPWPELARKAALVLSGASEQEDEPTTDARLLADCREVFDQTGAASLTPTELVQKLCDLPEAPWATWSRGQPLNTNKFAKLLKPYGIKSGVPRRGGRKAQRFYDRVTFIDAWERYLSPPDTPPGTVTSVTCPDSLGKQDFGSVTGSPFVTLRKADNSNNINDVTDVTDRTPPPRGEGMKTTDPSPTQTPKAATPSGEAAEAQAPADDEDGELLEGTV